MGQLWLSVDPGFCVLLRPEQILNCPPSLPPGPWGQLPLAQPRFTVCPSCQAQQEQEGGLSGLKHRDGASGAKQPKTTIDVWLRGQNTSQAGDGGGGRVTRVVF